MYVIKVKNNYLMICEGYSCGNAISHMHIPKDIGCISIYLDTEKN